jgi:hypothetical protein
MNMGSSSKCTDKRNIEKVVSSHVCTYFYGCLFMKVRVLLRQEERKGRRRKTRVTLVDNK